MKDLSVSTFPRLPKSATLHQRSFQASFPESETKSSKSSNRKRSTTSVFTSPSEYLIWIRPARLSLSQMLLLLMARMKLMPLKNLRNSLRQTGKKLWQLTVWTNLTKQRTATKPWVKSPRRQLPIAVWHTCSRDKQRLPANLMTFVRATNSSLPSSLNSLSPPTSTNVTSV